MLSRNSGLQNRTYNMRPNIFFILLSLFLYRHRKKMDIAPNTEGVKSKWQDYKWAGFLFPSCFSDFASMLLSACVSWGSEQDPSSKTHCCWCCVPGIPASPTSIYVTDCTTVPLGWKGAVWLVWPVIVRGSEPVTSGWEHLIVSVSFSEFILRNKMFSWVSFSTIVLRIKE